MSRRPSASRPRSRTALPGIDGVAISDAGDGHCWYEISGAFLSEPGVVRLREPAGADVVELVQRLRKGRYGKPFVFDDGENLRLHFSLRFVQSAMSLADPEALSFPYTRNMMAFLLFDPAPRNLVLVGLGGGSLTKFCHRQLPRTRVTTVEIDADVIALSELFHVPRPNARLRLVHADAADYFAARSELADAVLIDGCDALGLAPVFCDAAFYARLRERLRPGGMLVINLIGKPHRLEELERAVLAAFPGAHMSLEASYGGNRVLFVFREPAPLPDWRAIRRLAERLEQQHGLDFPDFARRLQRSWRAAD